MNLILFQFILTYFVNKLDWVSSVQVQVYFGKVYYTYFMLSVERQNKNYNYIYYPYPHPSSIYINLHIQSNVVMVTYSVFL